jgi:LacI family transcriptional regulator
MAQSVSVRDVAALAGVSVGTVSNVLNRPDKVSADTVARVQLAIERLGFVRNEAARQLREGRSRAIGLVILNVANPFFTDIARGAEDGAAAAGLSLILGNSDERAEREAGYLDLFEQQRVHGVLISPLGDVAPRLQRLRARGIPGVLVDRRSADASFSSVSVDDVAGGRLAIEHLIAQGRRRIAFVGGPDGLRQVVDRLHGASAVAASHPNVTLESIVVPSLTVQAGRAAAAAIIARERGERPDAVFAANDLLATGLLQGFVLDGHIAVPREIAIVGYDDIPFASAATVPLTSIRQPSFELGSTAVELLLAEAANPATAAQHVVFQPELVVRESSL